MGQATFNKPESSSTTHRTRFGALTITSTRSGELRDIEDAKIFAEYGEAVLGVRCPPELEPLVERLRALARQALQVRRHISVLLGHERP